MAYPDLDLNVSNEGKAMLREVIKFSMEVMRPAGIQLDRLPTPEEVIAPDSVLWQVLKGLRVLGLHTLQLPKALGGMAEDVDPLAAVMIMEQLGYADAGLAVSMHIDFRP